MVIAKEKLRDVAIVLSEPLRVTAGIANFSLTGKGYFEKYDDLIEALEKATETAKKIREIMTPEKKNSG